RPTAVSSAHARSAGPTGCWRTRARRRSTGSCRRHAGWQASAAAHESPGKFSVSFVCVLMTPSLRRVVMALCDQVLTSHGAPTAAARLPMQLSCQVSESHAEVALRGELDLASADLVVGYVSDVIDRYDGPVVADLHDVAFCDACGLGALVRIV